jgi:predicted aldo/keto reductase-like oxidoreductase
MAPIAITPPESQIDLSNLKNVDMARRDSTSPVQGVGGRKMPQRKRTIDLNDGHEIPQIALGVYKAPNGQETEDAIIAALDAGYRHIDSAARYMNEEACGRLVVPLYTCWRRENFADVVDPQSCQILVHSYRYTS